MTESKPTRRRTTKAAAAPVAEPKAPKPKAESPKPKAAKSKSVLVFKRRLSQGDHGPTIAEVQRVLTEQGEWEGPQDGRYGSLLAKAVRRFQGDNNIRPTGEVDLKTWEAMKL